MELPRLEKQVQELIVHNQLEDALRLMRDFFNEPKIVEQVILQSGRLRQIKEDNLNGTLEQKTFSQNLNEARQNILRLFKLAKADYLPSNETLENIPSIEQVYKLSLARISILKILMQLEFDSNGLTIRELFVQSKISKNKNDRKYIFEALQELESSKLVLKQKAGTRAFWSLTESGVALARRFNSAMLLEE